MAHLPTSAAPKVTLSSYSITVPIFRLKRTAEGVLIAHGSHSSGYTLYIKDNYLFYEYNYVGTVYKIQSSVEVPIGYSTIRFEFNRELLIKGTGKLYINGQQVGTVYMPRTLPFVISVEGLDIGRDRLTYVSSNYPVPEFPFTGQIERAVIEIYDDQRYSKYLKKKNRDLIYININGTVNYL
jgi:arylsulfatase